MRQYSGKSDSARDSRPVRAVVPNPQPNITEQTAKLIRGMPDSDAGEVQADDGSVWIRVDQTRPMDRQPRQYIDPDDMAIFIAGIAREGQQDPVLVRRVTNHIKYKYELIGGERRWLAATALGLTHLRAVIKNPADRFEQYKMAVIDNCGDAPLEALETAESIAELLKSPELRDLSESQQIAALGAIYTKCNAWVQYHKALLYLDPRVKAMMHPALPEESRLKTLMAAFISTIHNGDEQVHVAEHALSHGLSMQQTRDYARKRGEQRGFSVGARTLKPSDDYKRFRGFVRRFTIEIDRLQHMPAKRVTAMFGGRSKKERSEVLRMLQSKIDCLIEFRETLKEVDSEEE